MKLKLSKYDFDELYDRCLKIFQDYREVVPSYASAALAFHLVMILVPCFSLLAVAMSILNVNMSGLENMINQIITSEYASILIEVLESRNLNTMAFATIIASLWTIAKGIGNIYQISKNMFMNDQDESAIGFYLYAFRITFLILLLFVGVCVVLLTGPLATVFNSLYNLVGIRHILLYFLLVLIFMVIYSVVPRLHIHPADSFQGALVACALYLVLYYALSIYFRFANFSNVYGSLASVIIILWVFKWAAEIFYIGMYVTNILHLRRLEDEGNSD